MRAALLAALVACGDNAAPPPEPFCDAWHQWGGNAAHTGASCAAGVMHRIHADLVIDPFAPDEESQFGTGGRDLFVHYQVPLVDGDRVYAMTKHGTFTPCLPHPDPMTFACHQDAELYRLNSEIWTEVGYAWQGDALAEQWEFESDWKPSPLPSFEPMFQPALVGDAIAIPGAAGSVWLLDAATGQIRNHFTPFGDAPDTYVAGALAVFAGTIYYNALAIDHDKPRDHDAAGWLVAIRPDGTAVTRSYDDLVPDAPDQCYGEFDATMTPMPWPPVNADGSPILPPQKYCGAQVPGLNAAPAFAFDGTLYVVSHAWFNFSYSYVISVNPGYLRPNWASSLRVSIPEGCGITTTCSPGATTGVDPSTNLPVAPWVGDDSSSSPVALPRGGVIYGAVSPYDDSRGELLKFSDDGHFVASYNFGWDSTPTVISDAFGDRIVIKDNHYGNGVTTPGPYYLTELDASLSPIWQFRNSETKSCEYAPDGTLSCVSDHPDGFEWCVNAPAVDATGTLYANSEDGNIYAIGPTGELQSRLFLDKSLGAAYTPLAIDHAGRIYALNNGHMFVLGDY